MTQGTFNLACRTPGATPTNTPHQGYRLPNASPYYQKPYTGITLIEKLHDVYRRRGRHPRAVPPHAAAAWLYLCADPGTPDHHRRCRYDELSVERRSQQREQPRHHDTAGVRTRSATRTASTCRARWTGTRPTGRSSTSRAVATMSTTSTRSAARRCSRATGDSLPPPCPAAFF